MTRFINVIFVRSQEDVDKTHKACFILKLKCIFQETDIQLGGPLLVFLYTNTFLKIGIETQKNMENK